MHMLAICPKILCAGFG